MPSGRCAAPRTTTYGANRCSNVAKILTMACLIRLRFMYRSPDYPSFTECNLKLMAWFA
jgi:hypothetical protein